MMPQLKTRIAPTPSGYLHLGNAFSFILTALVARLRGGSILLRIDDLDRARYRTEYVEDIFKTLDFLKLEWEGGPHSVLEFEKDYSQLHRMPLYRQALDQLWERQALFACTCSRKEVNEHSYDGSYPGTCRTKDLAPSTVEAAWRLKTSSGAVELQNLDGSVSQHLFPPEMTDFLVRRKDGIPAYQLASLVDDVHFGINTVVRGEDLLDSTLAQLYLASKMEVGEFRDVRFLHHTLLKDQKGEKLSKSQGAPSILKSHISAKEVYYNLTNTLGFSKKLGSFGELMDFAQSENDLNLQNFGS